jgi:uncharacterized membrane protein (UPF0127 family)
MTVINSTKHQVIANNLRIAESIFSRMKGLLGRNSLDDKEGLLIKPCKGIHTFGMKFPIDVVFLDNRNRVIAVISNILPNRMTRMYLDAASVIELPAGTLSKTATQPGDQFEIN